MAARAIWKGILQIGPNKLPVKLYSAVQDRSIHFHILDSDSLSPVKQHMVEPESGKEIPSGAIQRGVELAPGEFVVLKPEELDRFEPESSRGIEVMRFVPPDRLSHQWFERPYYLGPDDNASEDYAALASALADSGREGIARWVMRKKQYAGALRVDNGSLMLVTLRHAEEVLSARELPAPQGRALDQREIAMAQQLVAALEGEFRPEDFHDEYRERVLKFVEEKAKGAKPKLHAIPRKREPDSLLDALTASLKRAKAAGGKAVA